MCVRALLFNLKVTEEKESWPETSFRNSVAKQESFVFASATHFDRKKYSLIWVAVVSCYISFHFISLHFIHLIWTTDGFVHLYFASHIWKSFVKFMSGKKPEHIAKTYFSSCEIRKRKEKKHKRSDRSLLINWNEKVAQ